MSILLLLTIFCISQSVYSREVLKVAYVTSPPFVIDPTAHKNPGVSISLINLIAEKLGMEISYREEGYDHELLTNGTFFKLSRDLIAGDHHLAVGRLTMNDTVTAPFAYGPVLYKDSCVFVAPKSKRLKSYRKLFKVFQTDIWRNLSLVFLGTIAIFCILGLLSKREKVHFPTVFFDTLRLTLGAGGALMPKLGSLRLLIVAYSLFALSMDAVYLSKLSTIFAFSNYAAEVNSIDKVYVTAISVRVNWQMERLLLINFVASRHSKQPNNMSRIVMKAFDQDHMLDHLLADQNHSSIVFHSLLRTRPNDASAINSFDGKTDYLSLFVTFYMSKVCPQLRRIQFWAQEAIERGLVAKWFADISRSRQKWSFKGAQEGGGEEEKLIVLKLAHFEEIFLVLFWGHALAGLCLLGEFLYQWLDDRGIVEKVARRVIFCVNLFLPPGHGIKM